MFPVMPSTPIMHRQGHCPACGSAPPRSFRPVVNPRISINKPDRYCQHEWHNGRDK